ncbi:MAG: hypothetical protein ACK5V3_15185 [Bdellovibrionales bacterium]
MLGHLKNYFVVASVLVSPLFVFADGMSHLNGASPESSSISYRDMSPAGVQRIIRQEIKQHCDENGLCKIYGVQTKTDTHWELSFSAGEGQQGSGQNVYYIGGTVNSTANSRYVGATLTIKGPMTCTTTVMVDPSVYRLIKSYMYSNVRSDGRVARDFTEAEKTVLMFYGKIIEKVATCQNGR